MRLAVFYLFPPSTFSSEMTKLFTERHQWVTLAPALLEALSTMTFNNNDAQADATDLLEIGLSKFQKVKGKSQKQLKREKRANGKTDIDTKSFETLGISIPYNRESADQETILIMSTLKAFLEAGFLYSATRRYLSFPYSLISKLSVSHTWPSP
jgi:hypothetical protein